VFLDVLMVTANGRMVAASGRLVTANGRMVCLRQYSDDGLRFAERGSLSVHRQAR
jgi:hypothetical protein